MLYFETMNFQVDSSGVMLSIVQSINGPSLPSQMIFSALDGLSFSIMGIDTSLWSYHSQISIDLGPDRDVIHLNSLRSH